MYCTHYGEIAFEKAKKFANRTALKYRDNVSGVWKDITWGSLASQVRLIAKALIEMGVKEEERVALFSQNMAEMVAVDLACQAVRATAVPLYATSSASQVDFIVNDAEIKLLFAVLCFNCIPGIYKPSPPQSPDGDSFPSSNH